MSTPQESKANWGLAAALGAAVAASACCTIPLLLVALGLGGAWIGTLTALEPLRPFFIAVAVGALAFAGWREWQTSRQVDCDCETSMPAPLRRTLLGVGLLAVAGLIASPWILAAASGDEASAAPVLTEQPTRATANVGYPSKVKRTAYYAIVGPFCSGCVGLLETTTMAVEGVSGIEVDVEARSVRVTFDDERATAEAIRDHVNEETTFRLALTGVKPTGSEPGARR